MNVFMVNTEARGEKVLMIIVLRDSLSLSPEKKDLTLDDEKKRN